MSAKFPTHPPTQARPKIGHRVGQFEPCLGQVRPRLAKVGQELAELNQTSPKLANTGECWSNLAKVWPRVDQDLASKFRQVWPQWANVGRSGAKIAQHLATCWPSLAEFGLSLGSWGIRSRVVGHPWATSGQLRSLPCSSRATSRDMWPATSPQQTVYRPRVWPELRVKQKVARSPERLTCRGADSAQSPGGAHAPAFAAAATGLHPSLHPSRFLQGRRHRQSQPLRSWGRVGGQLG